MAASSTVHMAHTHTHTWTNPHSNFPSQEKPLPFQQHGFPSNTIPLWTGTGRQCKAAPALATLHILEQLLAMWSSQALLAPCNCSHKANTFTLIEEEKLDIDRFSLFMYCLIIALVVHCDFQLKAHRSSAPQLHHRITEHFHSKGTPRTQQRYRHC